MKIERFSKKNEIQHPDMMVKHIAKDVKVVNQNLSEELYLSHQAERETRSLKYKVSPQLLMLLQQQLEPFSKFMQLEMAEDLVIFAYEHLAHTTGCLSADTVLDICYTWIAEEHGIVKSGILDKMKGGRV
jgi:hypothetical protein